MLKTPFIRSAYNYNTDEASRASSLACLDISKTQQQFKDECDINTIVRLFGITGKLPENVHAPTFGDFFEVDDFHSAQNAVRNAAESFMRLPANVRERFGNDPQQLIVFVSDDRNRKEAEALGLVFTPPPSLSHPPLPNKPDVM